MGSGTAASLAVLQLRQEVADVDLKEELRSWDVPLFFP